MKPLAICRLFALFILLAYQAWGRKYSTTSPNRLLTPEDALREAKARYDAKPRSNSVSLPLSPSKSSNLDGGTPTRGKFSRIKYFLIYHMSVACLQGRTNRIPNNIIELPERRLLTIQTASAS